MGDIPAPLANRHTAGVVVVVALLGAASAIASALVPDASLVAWLIVARRVVFAVEAVVIAVAALLVARTLVRRSRATLLAGLVAAGGLLLVALAQVGEALPVVGWGFDALPAVVTVLLVAASAATALGFAVLGVAVLRHRVWRGATRFTLPVAAVVIVAGAFFVPLVFALLSLVLLGLAPGLNSRRPVANAGVPQGAAPA